MADIESAVGMVVPTLHATIARDSKIPAWPVIHGSRKKSSTPVMFWTVGRKTPESVPSPLTALPIEVSLSAMKPPLLGATP
tara:strand:- start:118 stop:360 length:243 start_codon:yes stop_codon:yes gene_type:complete